MPSSHEISLSIVISFRNEERSLRELYNRIKQSLNHIENIKYEIIFVDDCSTDTSGQILKSISEKDDSLYIFTTSRPFGNAECLLAGLTESRGEFVIYLDADLQDPPEMIPEMYKLAITQNLDVIHTRRVSRLGESRIKLQITKLGYYYLNKFGSVKFEKEVGDFKLISRRVLNKLKNMNEVFPFPRGLVNYLGYQSTTIDYVRQPRYDGRENSKFSLFSKKWIDSQLNRTLISFSDAPLKALFYLGIATLFFTAILIVSSIVLKLFGLAIPGWTTIIVLLSIVIGFQSLFLGIMGLYLNVIFLQVKNRPLYLIDTVCSKGIISNYEK